MNICACLKRCWRFWFGTGADGSRFHQVHFEQAGLNTLVLTPSLEIPPAPPEWSAGLQPGIYCPSRIRKRSVWQRRGFLTCGSSTTPQRRRLLSMSKPSSYGCQVCGSLTFSQEWHEAFGVILCNSCKMEESLISKVCTHPASPAQDASKAAANLASPAGHCKVGMAPHRRGHEETGQHHKGEPSQKGMECHAPLPSLPGGDLPRMLKVMQQHEVLLSKADNTFYDVGLDAGVWIPHFKEIRTRMPFMFWGNPTNAYSNTSLVHERKNPFASS